MNKVGIIANLLRMSSFAILFATITATTQKIIAWIKNLLAPKKVAI